MKIDVVLQATSKHAHGVSQGIINTLRQTGWLGRIFKPYANWGDMIPISDDGLYKYLSEPTESSAILLLGFDWHSQCLHSTTDWRNIFYASRLIKVIFTHETLFNGQAEEVYVRSNKMLSAASLADIVWHSAPTEASQLKTLFDSKDIYAEILTSGFGVDTNFFRSGVNLNKRTGFAFFRGKVDAFDTNTQYQERRQLIKLLTRDKKIDIRPYQADKFSDTELANEYLSYKICLDLPSVFKGPTTRVYEALSCGCIVISKTTNFTQKELSELSPLLVPFRNDKDLLELIEYFKSIDDFNYYQINESYLKQKIGLKHKCNQLHEYIRSVYTLKINE